MPTGGSKRIGKKFARTRGFLELRPATIPILGQAQAYADTDDLPAPIEEMEENTGTAKCLVVGMGRNVHERW